MEQRASMPFAVADLTWERAIEVFLEVCRLKNLSPLSLDYYRQRLSVFAQFSASQGETPLSYSKATILAFIADLRNRFSAPTVNSYLRAIKAFSRWLVAEGLRRDNPMAGIAMLREGEHFPRTLTDEQIIALLNTFNLRTFEGIRNYAFVCFLLDTGLRLSEALNLEVTDIDFGTNSVLVRHAKGRKERVVFFSALARRYLLDYLAQRALVAQGSRWLWVTKAGTKISARSLREALERAARKASIEGVRVSPHSLRFTFVRKWFQLGGDSLTLQKLLGHSSPAMTAYYAKLFASDLASVHNRHSPLEHLSPMLRKRLR